jgi:hypothetical protein
MVLCGAALIYRSVWDETAQWSCNSNVVLTTINSALDCHLCHAWFGFHVLLHWFQEPVNHWSKPVDLTCMMSNPQCHDIHITPLYIYLTFPSCCNSAVKGPLFSLFLSVSLNSIQGALLAWETYVNIAKASEVDNIQKWNKPKNINSKHYTHKSSKRIKTSQM